MRNSVGLVFGILVVLGSLVACRAADSAGMERACVKSGWKQLKLNVSGRERIVLWNGPAQWTNGAIVVLHGGGGEAAHFCSGGWLVNPQINFAEKAVARGFAVFALDATTDVVTDSAGKACGKRFDFSVLDRPNVDLPYIEQVVSRVIPDSRPAKSNPSIFMTGLSTGGYMTIRAATRFNDQITAFAPISAGDPYGTDTNCDTSLSARTSAKGILTDRETGKEIVEHNACVAPDNSHESKWEGPAGDKPTVKQFHHRKDGIVDISCMLKAGTFLKQNGYPSEPAFVIESRRGKSALNHLWREVYNQPLLDFFAAHATSR